jgi:hypothetical protein
MPYKGGRRRPRGLGVPSAANFRLQASRRAGKTELSDSGKIGQWTLSMNLNHLTYQDVAMASRPAGTSARKGSIGSGFSIKTRTPVNQPTDKQAKVDKDVKGAKSRSKKSAVKTAKVRGVPFIVAYANGIHTDSKYIRDVTVVSMKKGKFNGWPGVLSKTVTVDGVGPPRKYNHHVVAKDGLPLRMSKACHYSCQCPRFLYFFEYALASRGAADILYCNGEPPVITNPRLIPSLCKHLTKVCEEIVRRKL